MNSLKKILLIDGDPLFGNSIKTVLSPRKYTIIHAPNCISGLHKAFQHEPDLIFYNTNLEPMDGSEVFKALQLTSSFNQIPIVYYKERDEKQIISFVDKNEQRMLSKGQNPNNSTLSTKNNPEQERKNSKEVFYDFNTLFHLSPNGMFIFDNRGILSVNKMLRTLLHAGNQELVILKLQDLFDAPSSRAIKQWMKDYLKKKKAAFNQQVILKGRVGDNLTMNLMISELNKTDGEIHFLGTLQALERVNPMFNYQLAQDVCNLLKRENLEVSEALEKKITHTIKLRAINEDQQKKSFFTKRENEVLRLSMEGLSIKIIADKLSLSTRTVEKYRTKLMLKSGAKNIVEVIVFSIKNNLLKI
jgi:DNA-binding NarL/FixJ family response regulator